MSKPTTLQPLRRAFRIVWILQGHTFDGLRLKQITEKLKTNPPTALRDLETMAEEGITERIPGNAECWRLTPKLIQLARAHDTEMQAMRLRVEEIDQRYTRDAK